MAKKSQEREDEARLSYQQGTSDKVYNVYLKQDRQGWVVETEYGRRGGTLTKNFKTARPMDWSSARVVFENVVREKTGKGYVQSGDIRQTLRQAVEQLEQQRQALSWLTGGDGSAA